jgi:hypothetical protein
MDSRLHAWSELRREVEEHPEPSFAPEASPLLEVEEIGHNEGGRVEAEGSEREHEEIQITGDCMLTEQGGYQRTRGVSRQIVITQVLKGYSCDRYHQRVVRHQRRIPSVDCPRGQMSAKSRLHVRRIDGGRVVRYSKDDG